MSHQPIAVMSGITLLGGITGYTRYGSPSALFIASMIGGSMVWSSMRIKDNMNYGIEGALVSSAVFLVGTTRRVIQTRAFIPVIFASAAAASTAYYANAYMARQR